MAGGYSPEKRLLKKLDKMYCSPALELSGGGDNLVTPELYATYKAIHLSPRWYEAYDEYVVPTLMGTLDGEPPKSVKYPLTYRGIPVLKNMKDHSYLERV